jgi:glycosyltransferase involved in cell wall biosynthesis
LGEEQVLEFIENGVRWFYSSLDRIDVPTKEYINLLENRGYDRSKMRIFKRGIDVDMTSVKSNYFEKKLSYGTNTILTYAGRVSLDKNLDFLIDVFKSIYKKNNNVYLTIVGDGPYFKELKHKNKNTDHIIFTGKLERKELPQIYSLSDIFVFPSNTDTFGMVVLEAQACGLPAIVTDIGGPQEIIKENETGYIVSTNNADKWEETICSIIDLKKTNLDKYIEMRQKSRAHILNNFNWEMVLSAMFEENTKVELIEVKKELQTA